MFILCVESSPETGDTTGNFGGKMKVGILGAGLQGKRRAKAVKQCGDSLVMVAAAHLERAKLLAGEMACEATASWEEVVFKKDIDTVIVCTPPNLHLPMCTTALKQGKHVLCEKPLARNPDEAEKIVKAAQETGARLKCGFNLRHHPGLKQAREWFESSLIGEPSFVRSFYGIGGRPGYDKEWRADADISGGGQLMDQGMHAIDLSRWFLGDFVEVQGFVQTAFWDMPVEDNAFCLLRTGKGQVASIHVSWTQWKNLFSFEVSGKEGYIRVEGLGGSYGVEKAVLGKRAFLEPFREETVEFRGDDRSWEEEWREFTGAIKENREPLANGYDGLQAVKLAYAVYDSAHNGGVMIK
jgi:predicted dehydrogenase